MAKSLRSKWKRKMRAIKRERYGQKELAKLKMIVETAKNAVSQAGNDIEMKNAETIMTVVSKPDSRKKDEPMEVINKGEDISKNKFPIWMGSHKRKKLIAINRKHNKIVKKEQKKAQRKKR